MSKNDTRRYQDQAKQEVRQRAPEPGDTWKIQQQTRAPDGITTRKTRAEELRGEIAKWRQRNSQSNPGAVMELRELQKELRELEGK